LQELKGDSCYYVIVSTFEIMNLIDKALSLITHDIGIDLGTSTTLIAVKGEGVVNQ